jgi:outer membrane biosynthesis protein TonB
MTVQAWSNKPVVLGHPYDSSGLPVIANQRDVLINTGIGSTWDASLTNNRLNVNVWLDIEKIERLGGDALIVLNKIRNHEPVEVSTGYLAVMNNKQGSHNNIPYSVVTDIIIPDHLAMLPNDLGACSWATGCGIPRVMEAKTMDTAVIDDKTMGSTILNFLRSKFGQEDTNPDNTLVVKHEIQGCSCGGVKAHAEEGQPVPEPVPEPTPVPEPVPDPNPQPNPEEPDEEPEPEESEVTVDTLQEFLDQHSITQEELVTHLQSRANRRQELTAVIKANSALTDADLQNVSDTIIETMATAYTANSGQVVNAPMYALQGLPVSQPTGTQVKKLERRKPMLDKTA